MALIATGTAVYVPAHVLVLLIGSAFRMAAGAGENCVVGRIVMARGAHTIGAPMVGGEPCVIEGRSLPGSSVVARQASGRKVRGCMIRIGRRLVIRLVARIAIRRDGGVVVVYMATGAGNCRVLAGERK